MENRCMRVTRGFLMVAALTLVGCAPARPPLVPINRPVDIERFMGCWYVLAHIPIDTFLASEAEAYNAATARRREGLLTIRLTRSRRRRVWRREP